MKAVRYSFSTATKFIGARGSVYYKLMALSRLFASYVLWHYTVGIRDLLGVLSNFLWFFTHFFAFGTLFSTLFSPWKRLDEPVGSVFQFEQFAGNIIANLVTRVAGAMVKLIFISIGALVMLGVLAFGVCLFLAWLLAPLFLLVLVFGGLTFVVL